MADREPDDFTKRESDSLEELTAERAANDRDLPRLIAAARARRAFMRLLASERRRLGVSQAVVARRMGTSQAFVSRFERALVDPQHSTEDRYAEAIGYRVERKLVPAGHHSSVEGPAPASFLSAREGIVATRSGQAATDRTARP